MYKRNPLYTFIAVSIPVILAAIWQIRPTFDDWTTLSSPNRDADFIQYFLPFGMTWRPGDALIGYINGISPKLFPGLNHLIVFFTHLGSTILVYKITKYLQFKPLAINIATLFFYISPCVLGNILSCDATNQSSAHLFGLLAVYLYILPNNKNIHFIWPLCVYLSAAFKDNGIAWAVIPPIIGYAFNLTEKNRCRKDFLYGLGIAIVYGIVRLSIPHHLFNNASYAEDVVSIASRIKGVATWIGYTWFSADYISIVHKPSRNFLLAAVTFLLSLPFMASLWTNKNIWNKSAIWFLILAFILVASPNLLISMTIMNAYGSLGIAALILAYLVQQKDLSSGKTRFLFTMYMLSVAIVDFHHWYNAWQTSLPEKRISQEIVRKTGHPVNKAYCIIVKDDYPKYSSFCVPKDETIGWGKSVWHETGYQWPDIVDAEIIERNEYAHKNAKKIARKVLQQGYEAVWIVDKEEVEVIKNKSR